VPTLDKIPKNAIFLTAKDLDDFIKWQDIWTKNGWLIAADYNQGFYSAIALKDTNVLCLGYKDPTYEAPSDAPEITPEVEEITEASHETDKEVEEIEEGKAAELAAINALEKI
jgi:hypothetical protein